jgi:hypothetical protein
VTATAFPGLVFVIALAEDPVRGIDRVTGDPHAHDWDGDDRGEERPIQPGEQIYAVPLPGTLPMQGPTNVLVEPTVVDPLVLEPVLVP